MTPNQIKPHPSYYGTPNNRELGRKSSSGKKTLVLDLDETLVHSSFDVVDHPDYIIPV
jgi:TFIIF-interacting CTD phosphatase-like protein